MKLLRTGIDLWTLELSERELLTVKASLRESFAYLEREDFPLRIGVPRDVALTIAVELSTLMDTAGIED